MAYKAQNIQCKAISKRTGQRCNSPAAIGQLICAKHGGLAPQNLGKAAEKVADIQVTVLERMEKLVPKAVMAMEQILDDEKAKPSDRINAAGMVLDRFVAKKVHAEVEDHREVRALDDEIASLIAEEETG